MKLRLTDFDSNTCTGMLDHPLYTSTSSYGESYTIGG